jgi:hypothetical protein
MQRERENGGRKRRRSTTSTTSAEMKQQCNRYTQVYTSDMSSL